MEVSKNENSIIDEDNEYNDWIELHNNHSETINLNNYSLSSGPEAILYGQKRSVGLARSWEI